MSKGPYSIEAFDADGSTVVIHEEETLRACKEGMRMIRTDEAYGDMVVYIKVTDSRDICVLDWIK